jgi:hypothetical protein
MTMCFRIVVPFRNVESGEIREITVQLSREETLWAMHAAARRGLDPAKDGFRPIEAASAVRRASLALGGQMHWDEINEWWFYSYPPGLEVIDDRVRRAPELRLA